MGSTVRIHLFIDFHFGRFGKCLAFSLSSCEKRRWFVLIVLNRLAAFKNTQKFSLSGAFLIPYFILYFLIGAPIYYLELALGQFSSRGPATAFILARGWQGKSLSRNFFFCNIPNPRRCWFRHDYQQCLVYALL